MRQTRESPDSTQRATFDAACALVDTALNSPFRQELAADLAQANDLGTALRRLREPMRTNVWKLDTRQINLAQIVSTYDRRTRQEGFHALHDWDGKADAVNEDTIAIEVLDYVIDQRGSRPADRGVLAILVDYYFLYLLALLSLRVWDDGHADDNLDRLNQLLRHLQGPHGSGQQFAANAETLILIATSHYELDERGYDTLLDRVRTLNRSHQTKIGLSHATSMGCHLRFGFEATYGRDMVAMRDDNVTDYPWLCYALTTVMKEYARMREEGIQGRGRDTVVEAMLNGLSPDARAFVGDHPPASLAAYEADRSEFREGFRRYRADLLEELERYRPSDCTYSPISFFFNFSQNVLKGIVVDALLWGEAWQLSLNDLLTGLPGGESIAASKETLAKTLMGYARANPDRIRGRFMPAIVYDPRAGRQAFGAAIRQLKE